MSKLEKKNIVVDSIKVDGKEIHNGSDLLAMITDDGKIVLQTSIGKTKIQLLEIILSKDDSNLIIKDEQTSNH